MKHVGKIAVCVACELALNAGLHAATASSPGNPYTPIVVRNIFGLNPPPPAGADQPAEPPPKITPNGIMTIFGSRQVLFKVSVPAKQGHPAKDDSYILGEGQRQDDIAVTRIDEKSSVVTFNNHGTVQEIPLTAAPAITTPAPAAVGANPNSAHNIPIPNSNNDNNGGRGFGRFGRNRGNNSNSNANDAGNGTNLRSVPTRQQAPQIDPDQQIIMMEVNRQATANQVLNGEMPPLPPTPLTPEGSPGYLPPTPGQ